MDEVKSRTGFPGDRSQAAAEKLRALRERANHALEEHRRRLGQIESELSQRIQQLSQEFETAAAARPPQPGGARDEELATLRRQLDEGRARHEKFVEQLAAARRQLDAIQAQPCAACHDAATQLADAHAEVRQLRDQLTAAEQKHQEDRARQDKFAEQIAAARQAISDLQAQSGDQSANAQVELDAALAAKAAAEQQLSALARDLEILHNQCDAAHTQVEQLQQELAAAAAEKDRAEQTAAALQRERDELAHGQDQSQRDAQAIDAELAETKAAMLTAQRDHAERLAAAEQSAARLQEQLAAVETQRQSSEASRADAAVACDELQKTLDALKEQLAAAEARAGAAAAELTALHRQINESRAETASQQQENGRLNEALDAAESKYLELLQSTCSRKELDRLQKKLDAAVASLQAAREENGKLQQQLSARSATGEEESTRLQAAHAQRDALSLRVAELERSLADAAAHQQEIADLNAALEGARGELVELREATCPRHELNELQQKFDLALADVQKLKRENSSLREDLATRPEASGDESPELVAVRTDRDALALRVAELEQAAAASAGAEVPQDAGDLQRRFEMAVDDVRQLKQENAQLRDRLATAGAAKGPAPATSGPLDWAAQRARLMESLQQEDDDGPLDSARKQERTTIEETISATDRVIAEKENELAELRAAVSQADLQSQQDRRDDQHEEILAADELIAAERQRLAELQTEWEGKMRSAEMEFSIERAKLAREQAALRERMFELQTAHPPQANDGSNKPRRRWRAALGLADEGEDPPKK